MKAENTVDFQIKSCWYAISRMYNTYSIQHDMSMAIGYVLLHIDKGGTPATKIAPALGLEVRSLTRMLKNLEDKKWIRRESDFSDKRVVNIFLTEEGKKKRDLAKQGVILFNELINNQIDENKMEVFFEVIQKINSIIEKDAPFIAKKINK